MQEKKSKNVRKVFFALVRAGLWGKEVQLSPFGTIELATIQQLAEEQSVVGLVAAGLEKVTDVKPAKKDVLQFIGQTLQLEQQNQAMNYFIGMIVEKMREAGIYTTLIKGQGVAQCYEKPLWRACGDVDLYLDAENYEKAKVFLKPLASSVEEEDTFRKHLGMTIGPWVVELHGTMHTRLSSRMNRGNDEVQKDIFNNGGVRTWHNGDVDVYIPSPDNDIIIIFTHFIGHFYVGGLGVRQISDWCRLLWTYRKEIDLPLLEKRLRAMRLMTEWKAFAAFAVDWLGMPVEAMPLVVSGSKFQVSRYKRKADKICKLIIKAGNFGHNIDESYRTKHPRIIQKSITLYRRIGEFIRTSSIFPSNAPRFFVTYVLKRANATV